MTFSIRHALVALPLGLVLSGCAGSQRMQSSHRRSSPQASARPSGSSASFIDYRTDEQTVYSPAAPATTDSSNSIALEQISQHVKNGSALVIDARSPEEFSRGHVRGAINVPAGEVDSHVSRVERAVSREQLVIIYCGSASCGSSQMVYEHLSSQGFTNMRVYRPGWVVLSSQKDLL